jgi:hypothetical protein
MRYLRYALALAVLACALSPALANGHKTRKTHKSPREHGASTFSGQCDLTGRVSFDPALTTQPQSVSQLAVADGTCSGEFVDRSGRTHQLSGSPMRFVETSEATNATCGGGTATGQATLRFAYGKIRAGFQEVRAGGAASILLSGARSGSAAGLATISNSEDPVGILQRCAGPGLDSVGIDAHASTTPSISG